MKLLGSRAVWFGVLMAAAVAACRADLTGPADYTVTPGQQFSVDLGTVGPGPIWDSVPQISSGAVSFVSVKEPPYIQNPGGPTQRFTFRAAAPGTVTITFRRSGTADVVRKVVEVR
jgi:hypothetical protein